LETLSLSVVDLRRRYAGYRLMPDDRRLVIESFYKRRVDPEDGDVAVRPHVGAAATGLMRPWHSIEGKLADKIACLPEREGLPALEPHMSAQDDPPRIRPISLAAKVLPVAQVDLAARLVLQQGSKDVRSRTEVVEKRHQHWMQVRYR